MARATRATQHELDAAVQALRDGEVVGFPTETVYGLGANAQHAAALQKIFELKGRPTSHPLIVHLPDASHVPRWAREFPDSARALASGAADPFASASGASSAALSNSRAASA